MMTSIMSEIKLFVKNQGPVLAVISILNLIAAPLVLPYALELQPGQYSSIPIFALVIMQVISALLIYVPVAAIGLFTAHRLGLGAPVISGLLANKRIPINSGRIMLYAIGIGIISGVGILLLIVFSNPYILAEYKRYGIEIPKTAIPGALQSLLGSISAGITEETLLRLGLLSFLGWFGMKISRGGSDGISSVVFWLSNIMSSLLFGALHLPLAASIMPLTPITIASTLILNSLAGIIFGWVYRKYGIEGAMIAHFSTDVVLHVIPPIFAL